MTQTLNVTQATTDDIAALEKLVNSAYRGETSKKGWTTEADLLDGIRTDEDGIYKMLHQPGSVILKCMVGNKLAGFVYLQKQADFLYLGMLTVSPELQA